MPARHRRAVLRAAFALALPLRCLLAAPTPAAEPERPAPLPPPPARTGKERAGDKAADEQRVNDCKVPPERRTRPRPTACPGEAAGR